jgi:hypothetical protein
MSTASLQRGTRSDKQFVQFLPKAAPNRASETSVELHETPRMTYRGQWWSSPWHRRWWHYSSPSRFRLLTTAAVMDTRAMVTFIYVGRGKSEPRRSVTEESNARLLWADLGEVVAPRALLCGEETADSRATYHNSQRPMDRRAWPEGHRQGGPMSQRGCVDRSCSKAFWWTGPRVRWVEWAERAYGSGPRGNFGPIAETSFSFLFYSFLFFKFEFDWSFKLQILKILQTRVSTCFCRNFSFISTVFI